MNKTLMIAAALLTLGAGSAFAEGYAEVLPAQVEHAPAAAPVAGHQFAFPAAQNHTVWVYGQFGQDGNAQGGQQ